MTARATTETATGAATARMPGPSRVLPAVIIAQAPVAARMTRGAVAAVA